MESTVLTTSFVTLVCVSRRIYVLPKVPSFVTKARFNSFWVAAFSYQIS